MKRKAFIVQLHRKLFNHQKQVWVIFEIFRSKVQSVPSHTRYFIILSPPLLSLGIKWCLYPMVISSEFCKGQCRDGDHREDASHFIFSISSDPDWLVLKLIRHFNRSRTSLFRKRPRICFQSKCRRAKIYQILLFKRYRLYFWYFWTSFW